MQRQLGIDFGRGRLGPLVLGLYLIHPAVMDLLLAVPLPEGPLGLLVELGMALVVTLALAVVFYSIPLTRPLVTTTARPRVKQVD